MTLTKMAKNTEITELEAIFLRKKPARLLVFIKKLREPYASTLAKKVDCTYSHTVKLLQKMENHGLIQTNKTGRTKYIELTDAGTELAEQFDQLFSKMSV